MDFDTEKNLQKKKKTIRGKLKNDGYEGKGGGNWIFDDELMTCRRGKGWKESSQRLPPTGFDLFSSLSRSRGNQGRFGLISFFFFPVRFFPSFFLRFFLDEN